MTRLRSSKAQLLTPTTPEATPPTSGGDSTMETLKSGVGTGLAILVWGMQPERGHILQGTLVLSRRMPVCRVLSSPCLPTAPSKPLHLARHSPNMHTC